MSCTFVLVGILVLNYPVSGQNSKKDSSADNKDLVPDLESQLIPLDSIMNIAIRNSPFIKGDSAAIQVGKYDVTLAKNNWMNDIAGFGNYATGNQKFGLQNALVDRQTNFLNGYRVGVNVSIPISEVTLRRTRVRQSKAEVSSLMFRREQTELGLRRQVAAEYNSLIASQKVLKIKSESLENFRVLYQLAEKQFREGTIPLEDYAYASDLTVNAETAYEIAKSEFNTHYQQFEYLIGVKLTSLMKRR